MQAYKTTPQTFPTHDTKYARRAIFPDDCFVRYYCSISNKEVFREAANEKITVCPDCGADCKNTEHIISVPGVYLPLMIRDTKDISGWRIWVPIEAYGNLPDDRFATAEEITAAHKQWKIEDEWDREVSKSFFRRWLGKLFNRIFNRD